MVIDDFDVRRTACAARPCEADSPLRVDPYAELTGAITPQDFETIASQRAEFIQTSCGVEDFKASISLSGKTLKFANETPIGERLGSAVAVAQDHR